LGSLDLETLEKRIKEIDEEIQKASDLAEKISKIQLPDLEAIRTEHNGNKTIYQGIITDREAVDAQCPDWKDNPTAAAFEQAQEEIWKNLSKDALKRTIQHLKDDWSTLQNDVNSLCSQISDAQNKISELEPEFNAAMKDSNFTVEQLLELNKISQEAYTTMKNKVVDRNAELMEGTTLLESAEKRKNERVAPADAQADDNKETLEGLIAQLEADKEKAIEERRDLKREIKDDDESLKDKNNITELLKLEKDYAKWEMFSKPFLDSKKSSNGLYMLTKAQGYVLSSLLKSANKHLSLMEPRYELQRIEDSLELKLLDKKLNDSTRATVSISGGESFLVSLSLALALADFGGKVGVDTLFIDEGFGTLSGVKLQAAINMLKQVHSNMGRKVGIISHREEIKENIPVQIVVDRPEDSSACTISVEPEVN